jgi:hypothetical protein
LEEFRDLTRDELDDLIGDPLLARFAMDIGRKFSSNELNQIFKSVKKWPFSNEPIEPIILE